MDYIGPDTEQWRWRDLYWLLHEYEGDRWAEDVIWPWTEARSATIGELREIGQPAAYRAVVRSHPGQFSPLEGMYALDRVLDVLIAPFQPVNDDPALLNWMTGRPWWTGRLPAQLALPALADAIGCARPARPGPSGSNRTGTGPVPVQHPA